MKRKFMTKIVSCALSAAMLMTLLAGCGNRSNENTSDVASESDSGSEANDTADSSVAGSSESQGTIVVDFWTAPEQYNLDFSTWYPDKFNNSYTQKKVKTN